MVVYDHRQSEEDGGGCVDRGSTTLARWVEAHPAHPDGGCDDIEGSEDTKDRKYYA